MLVTGGAGYVGSVLCRDLLSRGYEVRCVDNFYKGQCDSVIGLVTNPKFEFMKADVTDDDDVQRMVYGVDGIIHLAAIVGAPQCEERKGLAYLTNLEGTRLLLKRRGKTPLVFASTGSVYGKVEDVCTEESPLNTNSQYGLTKMWAENEVSEAESTVSFRFATGYGVSPNMRVNLLVNDLVLRAITERTISIFQGDFRRTFIHVRDMSRCFIWGLQRLSGDLGGGLKHKVYNAGDNELNWTKKELAEYIAECTNCNVTYDDVKADIDQRDYEVSYDKLNNEGFYCAETDMRSGIDELIKASHIVKINHQYM